MSKDTQIVTPSTRPMLLTTIDNPYNPFTQWDEWVAYDEHNGYFTNELLARVTVTTDDLGDTIEIQNIDEAMNEIVRYNVSGVHTLITADGTPGI